MTNSFFIYMDISGFWSFFEESGAGFDQGYALFRQDGEHVIGTLVYTEYIDLEPPFVIKVDVEGDVIEDRILLNGKAYEIIQSVQDIDYCLDDRIAMLDDPMNIEGHSVDDQNLEGRFIMRRLFVNDEC